jgi:phage terminase small subunit
MAASKAKSRPVKAPGTARKDAKARKLAFAEAYLSNGRNITKAALAVGFSAHTAAQQGSRLFKSADVQQVIQQREDEALAAARQKTNLTVEKVIQALARSVLFDPRKLFNADGTPKMPHELDEDTAAAISGIEFEVDKKTGKPMWAKYKGPAREAAQNLAFKHLGLLKEDNEQAMRPVADAISKIASIGPLKAAFAKRLGGAA